MWNIGPSCSSSTWFCLRLVLLPFFPPFSSLLQCPFYSFPGCPWSTYHANQAYLCVLCGSQNKQRLFPYTVLTVRFVQQNCVFTARYGLNVLSKLGRAMAQTDSRPPVSVEARVRFQFMLNLRCTKWQLDWVVTQYFCFPLSVSFHQCSALVFIYMLLLAEKQTGEAWGRSVNRGPSDWKEI